MRNKIIFFLTPTIWYFNTHRFQLLNLYKKKGYEVKIYSFDNKNILFKFFFSLFILFKSYINNVSKIHVLTLKLFLEL